MSARDLTILGCSSQQPTRRRNHSAYLIRWHGQGMLFDPGEGTQRQFIFANIAPTCVTKIFVSHFHGDHCLGLGSMLMRLNLDKVTHPIHVYYPASGKRYFDRLRYGTIYHEVINVVEHPVSSEGIVDEDEHFIISCTFLEHGVDTLGWRITERDERKFDRNRLAAYGIQGRMVKELEENGSLVVDGKTITLDDVSRIREGNSFCFISDTQYCPQAVELARGAELLLCESTYLQADLDLAQKHKHMTAQQAATIAKEAGAHQLILTHFSARYLDSEAFVEEACQIFPQTKAAEDLKQFHFPKR